MKKRNPCLEQFKQIRTNLRFLDPIYSHLSNKRGGWNKRGGGAKNWKITRCGGGNKHQFLS